MSPVHKISAIMTTKLVTIEPHNSVATAVRLMRRGAMRHLPVVEDDRLVGIVTSGDLRRITGLSSILRDQSYDNMLWRHIPIANVMTRDPMVLSPDTPVAEAARLLIEHQIGGFPVLDNGALVGIITTSDLLQCLIQMEEAAS